MIVNSKILDNNIRLRHMIVPFSREPRDNLLFHISYAKEQLNIAVACFLLDTKKTGERYVTVSGNVRKLDGVKRVIILLALTRLYAAALTRLWA